MKIIHAADLHLGSRLTSLPEGSIRNTRKSEILSSFNKLIDYAKSNEVKAILLSGDVFDSDRPYKKDKEFFYNSIKSNKDITFFYLRGNHDTEQSFEENLDNLLLFGNEWKSYEFEGIKISGIELSNENKTSLYSSLNLKQDELNIVLMHGDIYSRGKEFIDLKKLASRNIDYLALGHIHKADEIKIDGRGVAIYPGCLDGRGFDEIGEKGFYLLEINENKIHHEFIPFSSRIIKEIEVDLSTSKNLTEAKNLVEKALASIGEKSIVKILLTGAVEYDALGIEEDIYNFFKDRVFYLKVENKLKLMIKVDSYKNDFSLKGEFVRNTLADEILSEEEKEEILSLGIKALNGEELDK